MKAVASGSPVLGTWKLQSLVFEATATGDPCDGDAQDADHVGSSVIGGNPRPEARSTERREAGREVFG